MKKIFNIMTVIVICVLMAGCGKPAPTTKTVPVPAPDTWLQQAHQAGEVQIAPGDSFTVSLNSDEASNRAWEEPPEIINPSLIEKVDYRSESAPGGTPKQTWTFKGLAKGSSVILFKTSGKAHEVFDWTYSLFVAIKSPTTTNTSASGTLIPIGFNMADRNIDFSEMFYTHIETDIYELNGTFECKVEGVNKFEMNLGTGECWMRIADDTFTGTVDGKSGTLTLYKVMWGKLDAPDYMTGWESIRGTIISGTGELANLRGTLNDDYILTKESINQSSNYSYTIWWLD